MGYWFEIFFLALNPMGFGVSGADRVPLPSGRDGKIVTMVRDRRFPRPAGAAIDACSATV
ncbi:hypothetical protein GCM10009765_36700 [Fodinicola feengrottensis]|uniref:Uncharacterized protein n=1 Tax=Fodinicola feengrottensis TaxID=435914 RepID=A0ABP4T8I0_9ACTN